MIDKLFETKRKITIDKLPKPSQPSLIQTLAVYKTK